jgi:plasmid stabilization system protein ParE
MGQSWHASLRAGQAKLAEWPSLGRSKAEPEPVDAGATRNPVVPEYRAAHVERYGGRSVVERRSGLPLSSCGEDGKRGRTC